MPSRSRSSASSSAPSRRPPWRSGAASSTASAGSPATASFGVGAVLGNVLSFRLQDRYDGLFLVGVLVYGQALPVWALAFHPSPTVVEAAIFCSGLFNGLVNPSIHAIFTLRPPPAIRPRVLTSPGAIMMLSG